MWLESVETYITFLVRFLVAIFRSIHDLFTVSRKDVKGKLVVLTGAAGGIGRELAHIFTLELGAKIVLLDVNEKANEELAGALNNNGGCAYSFTVDVTKPDDLKETARKICNNPDLGDPDIVICNAGVLHAKSILELTENQLRRSFDINVLGYFHTIRAFLPRMLLNNHGHIAAISSVGGHFGMSLSSDYSASKFAVRGLMESLEWELVDANKSGIKVTTIYPFFTNTPLINCCQPESRFFDLLKPRFTAERIVDAILTETVEAYIPACHGVLCKVIKGLCTQRVKYVLRDLFAVRYKPLENGFLQTSAKNE